MSVSELEEEFRHADEAAAAQLRAINKADAIHGARHRAAVLAESFPPAEPTGIVGRVTAALRGS